jgi:hypothetical protein
MITNKHAIVQTVVTMNLRAPYATVPISIYFIEVLP